MSTMRRRWSDNDRFWGPFTYSKNNSYNPIGISFQSGEEEYPGASLRISLFGWTFISPLPSWLISPHKEKVYPKTWDEQTIERLGRNWYWQIEPREYSISLFEGCLHIHYGRDTMDSSTDKSWCKTLPWCDWRFVRHSYYGLDGQHFASLPDIGKPYSHGSGRWEREQSIRDSVPTVSFSFDDYDGERITATTLIEEREWKRGAGWFKWLSWFAKPRVKRNLDIWFSAETGKRKGSWKGGTIGHSIAMLPGEFHADAFKRYCAENKMTYVKQRL